LKNHIYFLISTHCHLAGKYVTKAAATDGSLLLYKAWLNDFHIPFNKADQFNMALSLDDYKSKLISKIHIAISQDEVRRFVDCAIKALRANRETVILSRGS
jgi:hypothetical protein